MEQPRNPYQKIVIEVSISNGAGQIQIENLLYSFTPTSPLYEFIEFLDLRGDIYGITNLKNQTIPGTTLIWRLTEILLWFNKQLYQVNFKIVKALPWYSSAHVLALFSSAPSVDPANEQFRSPQELKEWITLLNKYKNARHVLSRPNRNRALVACKYILLHESTFKEDHKCDHDVFDGTHNYINNLKALIKVLRKEPSINSTNVQSRRDEVRIILEHGYELCNEAKLRLDNHLLTTPVK